MSLDFEALGAVFQSHQREGDQIDLGGVDGETHLIIDVREGATNRDLAFGVRDSEVRFVVEIVIGVQPELFFRGAALAIDFDGALATLDGGGGDTLVGGFVELRALTAVRGIDLVGRVHGDALAIVVELRALAAVVNLVDFTASIDEDRSLTTPGLWGIVIASAGEHR